MSSAELEFRYPEMRRIRHDVRAAKSTCGYCSGRFPAQLVSCPHCGASVKNDDA